MGQYEGGKDLCKIGQFFFAASTPSRFFLREGEDIMGGYNVGGGMIYFPV